MMVWDRDKEQNSVKGPRLLESPNEIIAMKANLDYIQFSNFISLRRNKNSFVPFCWQIPILTESGLWKQKFSTVAWIRIQEARESRFGTRGGLEGATASSAEASISPVGGNLELLSEELWQSNALKQYFEATLATLAPMLAVPSPS